MLNELGDGDEYMGKPLLLPVETVQFDEEEDPRYRARLLLIDDDEEEYLEININVKQKGDVQTNVHNASSLNLHQQQRKYDSRNQRKKWKQLHLQLI